MASVRNYSSGALVVAWQQDHRIVVRTRPGAVGDFDPPVMIRGPVGQGAKLAMSAPIALHGVVMVAWSSSTGLHVARKGRGQKRFAAPVLLSAGRPRGFAVADSVVAWATATSVTSASVQKRTLHPLATHKVAGAQLDSVDQEGNIGFSSGGHARLVLGGRSVPTTAGATLDLGPGREVRLGHGQELGWIAKTRRGEVVKSAYNMQLVPQGRYQGRLQEHLS